MKNSKRNRQRRSVPKRRSNYGQKLAVRQTPTLTQPGDTDKKPAERAGSGVVSHINRVRKFGFIKGRDGIDVYFTLNVYKGEEILRGQEVHFSAYKGEKGWRAKSVMQ